MATGTVTSDEMRDGLSAFFADADLDRLKKPEQLATTSDFSSARQLDASDFIIDSMDVVVDEPVAEPSVEEVDDEDADIHVVLGGDTAGSEFSVAEVSVDERSAEKSKPENVKPEIAESNTETHGEFLTKDWGSEVSEVQADSSGESEIEAAEPDSLEPEFAESDFIELSVSEPVSDELHVVAPSTDESDLIEGEYTSAIEDIDNTESESVDDAEAVSEPDMFAAGGEPDRHSAEKEGGISDTPADELNLHEALLSDVDIDLFGDAANTTDTPDSNADEQTSDEQRLDAQGSDDQRSDEQNTDEQRSHEQRHVDAGTIETDLDHSVQLVSGELQPVGSSALVINQKTAEIAEYYPAIDPLDSTQSDFDLDIPDAPVPGGFLRRWYIRGAAYLKQIWRRIRRTKSDPEA